MRSTVYWANLDITGRLGTFYRMQFWAFVALSGLFIVLSYETLIHLDVRMVIALFAGYVLIALTLEKVTWDWASLDNTIQRLYPVRFGLTFPGAAPIRTSK